MHILVNMLVFYRGNQPQLWSEFMVIVFSNVIRHMVNSP